MPDLAYAAGIVDGEGTININGFQQGGPGCMQLQFYVSMIHTGALQLLSELFGGDVKLYTNSNGNPIYRWGLTGSSCEIPLIQLIPFLRVKKRQAEIALALISTSVGSGQKHSDENVLIRQRLLELMREANSGV